MWIKNGSGLTGWFWLRVFHEIGVKTSGGGVKSTEGLAGAEGVT